MDKLKEMEVVIEKIVMEGSFLERDKLQKMQLRPIMLDIGAIIENFYDMECIVEKAEEETEKAEDKICDIEAERDRLEDRVLELEKVISDLEKELRRLQK